MELIYRASKDGGTSNDFHNKCDNKGQTICLFKNEKGNIFGGYASISWDKNGGYRSAPDSFIFTLTNIHNTQPTKFPNSNQNYSLYFNNSYGQNFGAGHDICIYSDFMNSNEHYSNFPHSYQDSLGKGYSIFSGQQNNKKFKLKELEVFKLLK